MGEQYHILKLNNGEEVITKIVDSDAEILILERPMVFRSFLTQDSAMRPKEIVIIKDWSVFSEEKFLSIPKSSVMMTTTPCKEAIKMYESEKDRQDNEKSIMKLKQEIEDEIDQLINEHTGKHEDPIDINEEEEFKKMMEHLSKNTQKMEEMINQTDPPERPSKKSESDMVFMNMMFPPEIIVDLVESGAIDPEFFGEMYLEIKSKMKQPQKKKAKKKPTSKRPNEKIKDEYTGDQKDRKNFGNLWSDWSDDPNSQDYK